MEDITNRVRKRRYGVTLVTHLPTEVSKKVGDLTNTKVAFGLSGSEKWIRDFFGKDFVSEINSLPTGYCRIAIKVNRENQGPINARLKIPYIGNKEALPEEIE
jgi:DNA helicase HerA-like ATPase